LEAVFRGFFAVELEQIESAQSSGVKDSFGRGVDEHPDLYNRYRELSYHFSRGVHGDPARTFVPKNKPERVGPSLGSHQGVGQVSDTTNLYYH
jgi:hypothetical protein